LPKLAERQAALHWLRAYDLAKCRTGYTMITPTPQPELLIQWMLEDGFDDAAPFAGLEPAVAIERIDEIMDAVRTWVRGHDATELWWTAQERHVAFGGVHEIAATAEIPQFEHRDFWVDVPAADGGVVRQPGRLARLGGGEADLKAPPEQDTPIDTVLDGWPERDTPATGAEQLKRPLSGIRIADFTWVLAGPFATRMMGDLGADAIRIQNEERSTIVNSPDYPYYFVWNRSKRSATIDMKHPSALDTVRRLIENCDVLIENYSAGVLDKWGLDWDTVHRWNPRLVYVTMSGCGHDGPWQHVISYAPTVHAVCGVTHLTNFEDRGDVGAGFSLNDHLAGFAAVTTLLAALHRRDQTGVGEKIDMAQLEVGTYSVGPAMLDYFANGHEAQPHGNRDGLQDHVPNEVYPTADGFVAVTATTDEQWRSLVGVVGHPALAAGDLAEEVGRRARRGDIDTALRIWASERTAEDIVGLLQAAGVPAGKVQHAGDLAEHDPQLIERGFWIDVDHDVFGPRRTDTFPAKWDGERLLPPMLSPAYLGEHNFDVWTEVAGLEFDAVAEGIGDGLFG
ncbi:MAG: CoA transferase, partial [Actinomycetota bacterium]|nr:CoA transferase [Actinomycetota bacterium]